MAVADNDEERCPHLQTYDYIESGEKKCRDCGATLSSPSTKALDKLMSLEDPRPE